MDKQESTTHIIKVEAGDETFTNSDVDNIDETGSTFDENIESVEIITNFEQLEFELNDVEEINSNKSSSKILKPEWFDEFEWLKYVDKSKHFKCIYCNVYVADDYEQLKYHDDYHKKDKKIICLKKICCVCSYPILTKDLKNVFTSKTRTSNTLAADIIGEFIGEKLSQEDGNIYIICNSCFSKLDEYDEARFKMLKIQEEFIRLLQTDENIIKNDEYEVVNYADFEENESVKSDFSVVEKIKSEEITVEEYEITMAILDSENNSTDKTEFLKMEYDKIQSDKESDFEEYKVVENPIKMKKTYKKRISKEGNVEKRRICEHCGELFKTYKDYYNHKKTMHKERKYYICHICGAKYGAKCMLNAHIAIHNGVIKYECKYCKKVFLKNSILRRHIACHTGEKFYKCEICLKEFTHHSSFSVHKLIHSDTRNSKCEICGKLFRSNSHLGRHKKVHSGDKNHACSICGRAFAQRYNMTAHIQSYHYGIKRAKKKPNVNTN